MYVLHIEGTVTSFDDWKNLFDSRPHDRTYRILRPIDNPNAIIIEAEFATANEAEAVLPDLRTTWSRMQGIIFAETPKARIAEVVQSEAR